jgi:hypothetical protein
MKYLKRFNESVNEDDIQQTIEDILLPITDMGYKPELEKKYKGFTTLVFSGFIIKFYCGSHITKKWLTLNDEVKEEFKRMYDYLESVGLNSIDVLYVKNPGFTRSTAPAPFIRVPFSVFIKMEDFELIDLEFEVKYNIKDWNYF